jgi:hypothetical protein
MQTEESAVERLLEQWPGLSQPERLQEFHRLPETWQTTSFWS